MAKKISETSSSDYVENERRDYFLYVIQSRAIPHMADGLRAAARRLLWVAKSGNQTKTATLAGYTLPFHPHDTPEDVASLMAAKFKNNIPLMQGSGAFGTMLKPESYGAPRYTDIKISPFSKDVVLRDIEIIPMKKNYDDTLDEPVHFLPLIPLALLNPSDGIAGGFRTKILPRSLEDIVTSQIMHLQGHKIEEKFPKFVPTQNAAVDRTVNEKSGNIQWKFEGDYEEINASELWITKIPYGLKHIDIINHLMKLEEQGEINDFEDHSKKDIKIRVKLGKGELNRLNRDQVLKKLYLVNIETEIINLVDFDGTSVVETDYAEVIRRFSDWRLGWYKVRYERLLKLTQEEMQRCKDILTAIKHNAGGVASKTTGKAEFCEFLEEIKIVYVDYIASLPMYRLTKEEAEKVKEQIVELTKLEDEYQSLLKNEGKRRKVYVDELKEVLKKYA